MICCNTKADVKKIINYETAPYSQLTLDSQYQKTFIVKNVLPDQVVFHHILFPNDNNNNSRFLQFVARIQFYSPHRLYYSRSTFKKNLAVWVRVWRERIFFSSRLLVYQYLFTALTFLSNIFKQKHPSGFKFAACVKQPLL